MRNIAKKIKPSIEKIEHVLYDISKACEEETAGSGDGYGYGNGNG